MVIICTYFTCLNSSFFFSLITGLRNQTTNSCTCNIIHVMPGHVCSAAAAAAASLQSCPTLGNPRDGSPPGSPVPGILQARTLEWVAISLSNVWKWKVEVKLLSCVWLFATPWTAAYQAPPSMGFSRQEYWSGVPSPSPMVALGTSLYKLTSQFTWVNVGIQPIKVRYMSLFTMTLFVNK